jgi:glycosyltransferase involved in cell wall biosynthesis
MKSLAIIIPAYKDTYLRETLDSLVSQTINDFVVYIGDDCSPYNLQSIISEYEDKLNIVYVRFDNNLGGKSLVAQWNRCVAMSKEKYIWLFSDDDLLPPDAVERFWNFEESHKEIFDICRLPLELVDRNGNTTMKLEDYPRYMCSEDYLKKRLSCEILSSASEYIFTREIYNKCGFVEFPLAWCSDDASWAQMAKEKGLYTIEGLAVQFRMSGDNISSCDDNYTAKFRANLSFVEWISNNFDIPEVFLYNYLIFVKNIPTLPLQNRLFMQSDIQSANFYATFFYYTAFLYINI